MKKLQLLFVALLLAVSSAFAQTEGNEPTYYKVTFLEIDQFQLKEMVPVCSEIFNALAENKGEPDVLYFRSNETFTQESLQEIFTEKKVSYNFELKIILDEN